MSRLAFVVGLDYTNPFSAHPKLPGCYKTSLAMLSTLNMIGYDCASVTDIGIFTSRTFYDELRYFIDSYKFGEGEEGKARMVVYFTGYADEDVLHMPSIDSHVVVGDIVSFIMQRVGHKLDYVMVIVDGQHGRRIAATATPPLLPRTMFVHSEMPLHALTDGLIEALKWPDNYTKSIMDVIQLIVNKAKSILQSTLSYAPREQDNGGIVFSVYIAENRSGISRLWTL